ncbi:MAG: OmcA/MtrC family decaheme c-type cytochrome [Thermodesulfobacteriota bacterium]
MKKYTFLSLFLIILWGFSLTLTGCNESGGGGESPPVVTSGTALRVDIMDAEIPPDRHPVVTFRLTDDMGNPLSAEGVRIRLLIAFIAKGDTQYTDYIINEEGQPAAENSTDGTLEPLGDGVFKYTFETVLPEDYERDVTHTVGIYADRSAMVAVNVFKTFVANSTFDFVPSGGPVTVIRDVVRTDACNSCHDPLALHGGFRRAVPLCVLCHTPQNIDPETGNSLDFKVMVHKIHRGAELPSVQAGMPYQIIGFNDTVIDFSDVEFPQDIRNCTKCHTSEATQSDDYKEDPSRVACGSCHDDVDFATGKNHGGGVQLNDGNCSGCHIPDSGTQFDRSVTGAHTIPLRADTLPGVNFEIVDVRSAETGSTTVAPGEHAEVTYSIKTDAGEIIDPKDMDSFSLVIAGPTTDYNIQDYHGNVPPVPGEDNVLRERPAQDSTGPDGSGNFTYTFKGMIPPNGTGTYAVGIEGRITRTVGGNNLILQEEVEEAGQNVVFYFPVTDLVAMPRRIVVDNTTEDQFCNACHGVFSKDFSIHGNLRNNTEYCVLCHNPSNDDIDTRPADAAMPTASINFRVMIHKIHTGEDLTVKPYIIYGFGGNPQNFSHLLYPGNRANCEECHLPKTNLLDPGKGILGPDILDTIVRDFTKTDDTLDDWTNFTTTPVISTCTSCHDNLVVNEAGDVLEAGDPDAGTEHLGGTQPESACVICHGVGEPLGVEVVHLPPLPPDQRINRPQ